MKKRSLAGFAIAALLGQGALAQGVTTAWTNTAAGGGFYDAGNWDNGVPGADDTARVNQEGAYTVSLNTDAHSRRLEMDAPAGSAASAGFNFGGGGSYFVSEFFRLNNMNLTLSGGALDAYAYDRESFIIGSGPGDDGATLTVGAGGRLLTRAPNDIVNNSYWADWMAVGDQGSGNTLVVQDGGQWISDIRVNRVGQGGSSHGNAVIVTGPGSLFSGNAMLVIGQDGYDNSLLVHNGGVLIASNGVHVGTGGASHGNTAVVKGPAASGGKLPVFFGRTDPNDTTFALSAGINGSHNGIFIDGCDAWVKGTHAGVAVGKSWDAGSGGDGNLLSISNSVVNIANDVGNGWSYVGGKGDGNTMRVANSVVTNNNEMTIGNDSAGNGNSLVIENSAWVQKERGFTVGGTGTNNTLVINDSTFVVADRVNWVVGGNAPGSVMRVANSTFSVTNEASFFVGYPAGNHGRAEFVDSIFNAKCPNFEVARQGWCNTLSFSGPKTRATLDNGIQVWNYSNHVEVVNGAWLTAWGLEIRGAGSSGLVSGSPGGVPSTLEVGGLFVADNDENAMNYPSRMDVMDGAKVIITGPPESRPCRIGPPNGMTDDNIESLGNVVCVDNATLTTRGPLDVRASTLHVKGMSEVSVTGQNLSLQHFAVLECTLGAEGFNPLEIAWGWNIDQDHPPKLVVNGEAFQKAGGRGWVVLATNVAYQASNRFEPQNVFLNYEGAKPGDFEENPYFIRVHIPSVRRTLFIVK